MPHACAAIVMRPDLFQLEGYDAPKELNYTFAISATEVLLNRFLICHPDEKRERTAHEMRDGVPPAHRVVTYAITSAVKRQIQSRKVCES